MVSPKSQSVTSVENCLFMPTSDRSAIHNFKLCDCFALIVLIWWGASCFASYYRKLHMLDFDTNKQKIYLADNHVLQMIPDIRLALWPAVQQNITHFDLLYSNSMCKQSSMPTSILIELLLSGGMRYECTQMSLSFATSAIRLATDTRIK
jgi:hypothetical protein